MTLHKINFPFLRKQGNFLQEMERIFEHEQQIKRDMEYICVGVGVMKD